MKRSDYTDYDQLPLFLTAEMTAKLLGISLSSAYELMHEEGFPALRIGNRIVVPKEKFCRWVDRQTGGARCSAPCRGRRPSETTTPCRKSFAGWACPPAKSLCTPFSCTAKTAPPTSATPATAPSARPWA